jgi:UDP-glucose 4-epimerase
MTRFRSALVTGGSGFLGRALVERLLAAGVAVTCVLRGHASAPQGATVLRVDRLTDLAGMIAPPAEVVFHLAAYGVHPHDRDASEMFSTNVAGTVAIIDLARRVGAGAVVYSGSCSEYAEVPPPVLMHEATPLTTRGLYGAAKAAAGLYGQTLASEHGLPFQWLRLFGIYGPGEGPHRLLPYLLRRLARHERTDLTPGEQVRDLLYIDDAVDGLLAGAAAALDGVLGPFNLCSAQPLSIRSVAEQAADLLGRPRALLDFGGRPYRSDEIMWMVGDNVRFAAATGWRPRIALDQGIERMLDRTETPPP